MPFSLSNKQPLQEKEREKGELPEVGNWELGTGQLKNPNPLANWGSGKLKLKLKSKSKSYPVPKSLHVSYLIFCYKLKDFNDTLDDGDDRSANWNCLLKVRITEQPARQAKSTGTGTRAASKASKETQTRQTVEPAPRWVRKCHAMDNRARPIECAVYLLLASVCKSRILLLLLLLPPLTAGNSLSVFIASIKMDTSHLQAGYELDSGFVSLSVSFCISMNVSVFAAHCGLALKLGKYCT